MSNGDYLNFRISHICHHLLKTTEIRGHFLTKLQESTRQVQTQNALRICNAHAYKLAND